MFRPLQFFLVLSVGIHIAVATLWGGSPLPSPGNPRLATQVSLLLQTTVHPAEKRSSPLTISRPETALAVPEKPVDEEINANTSWSNITKAAPANTLNTADEPAHPEDNRLAANSPATDMKSMAPDNHEKINSALQRLMSANFSYPPIARRRGWEGNVLLGVRLEANGELSNVQIIQSSGYPLLDRSALRSAGKARSTPEIIEWLAGDHIDMVLPVEYHLLDS